MPTINPTGLYCAYLRKSRRDLELEALGQGETLARHEAQLSELAARLGIAIAHTYREIVSGDTIAERPQAQQLLADISAGRWDGVLVMDVDRLGRGDSIDQGIIMQTIFYAGVLVITPDKIYDPASESDSEFFEIKLFFSRREYAMIKKRMQRGRIASVMDGCYLGARAPYGYEHCRLPGGKKCSLRPVPEKADVVRSIFAWYADGMDGKDVGSYAIATRLNEMGLRTELGSPWTPSSVRTILRNSTYIGKIHWNERVTRVRVENGQRIRTRPRSEAPILVDGLHEPIVDRALFDRVQAMFATHAKRPKNAMKDHANPLGGLVVCSVCGRLMQAKGDPNRRGDFLYCPTQHCPTCATYMHVVEAVILEELAAWTAEFDAPPDPASDADALAHRAALQQLTEQRATLDGQMDRLYDLLEQGIYTPDLYRQRRDDLTARRAALDDQISALNTNRPDPRAALVPTIKTVLAAYHAAPDPAAKNALLRQVLDHITYDKPRRCYRNDAPAAHLTLHLYPRLPDDF